MAAKFTIDPVQRLFLLDLGVTTLDAKIEFYSDAKEDWLTDPALVGYRFPIRSIAGDDIGGGASISPYYQLTGGWRIRGPEEDAIVTVVGNIITDTGDSPFVQTVGVYHTDWRSQVTSNSLTNNISGITVGGLADATAAAVWAAIIEAGFSASGVLKLIAAATAGEAEGMETTVAKFRGLDDSTTRIEAPVDQYGNRPGPIIRDAS